jgi:hypothetical protein
MAHAFTPPAHIRENEALRELYDEIVARMRREAEGIPMETNQLLLLAQIAADFVEMKYRDDTDTWPGANSRKDAKAQWISLMAEWRQVLKDNKEKISEGIVNDFIQITNAAVKKVRDDENRKEVVRFLKEQFSSKGY